MIYSKSVIDNVLAFFLNPGITINYTGLDAYASVQFSGGVMTGKSGANIGAATVKWTFDTADVNYNTVSLLATAITAVTGWTGAVIGADNNLSRLIPSFAQTQITGDTSFIANQADNFESYLKLCDTHYGVTVQRLTSFDIVNPPNLQYPLGVIYEDHTPYTQETLQNMVKQYHFFSRFADSQMNLNKLRINLYSYRDSVTELVEKYKDLNGICSQAYMLQIKPPAIFYENGNYNGYIECQFIVEVI